MGRVGRGRGRYDAGDHETLGHGVRGQRTAGSLDAVLSGVRDRSIRLRTRRLKREEKRKEKKRTALLFFCPKFRPQERSSADNRQPQQIVHVSLHKDPVYEDFGFSVSDGLYERGVFINRLRPGGPCDGVLRPYDRIIRVNEASTEDCDCCLAVPLIAAAGPRLELTVARPLSPQNVVKAL